MGCLLLPKNFDEKGLLPPEDYEISIENLITSMLVEGPHPRPIHWDQDWRRKLVLNLNILANQLWSVGIKEIFIDGSFVEEKDHPNDIDGYFECDLRSWQGIQNKLNTIDPYQSWDWPEQGKPKMWHNYKVELFPHFPGFPCGIDDITGYPLEFPAAFRQSRNFDPKGIVKLVNKTGVFK